MNTRTNHGANITLERIEAALAFARPPYDAELHNPDNLTPEQVGAGYRLPLKTEATNANVKAQEKCKDGAWVKSGPIFRPTFGHPDCGSYRLPLSVPWPEQPAPFALPTPPPGKEWHRTDGWTAEMLPPGTRPLCFDEHSTNKTQQLYRGRWVNLADAIMADSIEDHLRTTRPLLFQHAGHEWVWHRAGDPMPCEKGKKVYALYHDEEIRGGKTAELFGWGAGFAFKIIGWRYADEAEAEAVAVDPCAELKAAHAAGLVIQFRSITSLEAGHWASPVDLSPGGAIDWGYPVECFRMKPAPKQKLGPSDVPPNCAFRAPDWNPSIHVTPSLVAQDGVTWIRKLMISASAWVEYMSFQSLKDAGWLINRPKHRDENGNPTLWEKCEK